MYDYLIAKQVAGSSIAMQFGHYNLNLILVILYKLFCSIPMFNRCICISHIPIFFDHAVSPIKLLHTVQAAIVQLYLGSKEQLLDVSLTTYNK